MAGWPPAVSPSAHFSVGVQLCSLGGNWAPWPAVITPLNQGCNPITMQSAIRAPAPRLTELTEDGGRSSAQIWQNSEDVLSPCLYFYLSSPLSYWTPVSLLISNIITFLFDRLVNWYDLFCVNTISIHRLASLQRLPILLSVVLDFHLLCESL